MATRLSLAAPNLPVGPNQYERRYQEQLNNVQRLFYTQLTNAVNLPYPYGSFYSSTQVVSTAHPNTYPTDPNSGYLSNPLVNAVNLVPFLNTAQAYNTNIGAVHSRIYVAETAVYNIQFSAQCNLASGGSAASVYFWLRKNGVNVAATSGKLVVSGPNSETMAAWNYLLTLQENDYIELAWSSSETHMYLEVESGTSVRPVLPAVILTIVWASPYNTSGGIS